MDNTKPSLGTVYVSERAIATIAYQSALESYGVVGLAAKSIVEDLANVLVKEPLHGVDVHYDGNSIVVDLYIIIEYGTRLKSVASSVADSVKFQVEKAIGLQVSQVNIHVRGLRISNPD
jgi:uncharacterized alkaline shock family protein YloU